MISKKIKVIIAQALVLSILLPNVSVKAMTQANENSVVTESGQFNEANESTEENKEDVVEVNRESRKLRYLSKLYWTR